MEFAGIEQLSCGILSIGRAANDQQARGVAQALGFITPDFYQLTKTPFHALKRHLSPLNSFSGVPHSNDLPQVLINVGWQTAPVAQALKQQHPELFVIQILRPSMNLHWPDIIVVPQHDELPHFPHIISTLGAPNALTSQVLQQAVDPLKDQLNEVTGPYQAVLVGGHSKHFQFSELYVNQFIAQLEQYQQAHVGSLLITTSRRTPITLRDKLSSLHNTWQYHPGDVGENPYLGMLGIADEIIVTADSISMVSEACRTTVPVYIWGRELQTKPKFKRFYEALIMRGRIKDLGDHSPFPQPIEPLSDTEQAAGFIRAKLLQHFGFTA